MNETERLIRAYFDAFNAHDSESRLVLLDENVRHDINEGGTEVGVEAFRRFIDHMAPRYREQVRDLVVMTAGGNGAAEFICEGEYVGTDEGLPEAKGQRYAIPAAAFFEVERGKITRVTSYYNLRGWIEAIGG
jgi:steroid delta-isomerase-like uncharacterized protein